MSLQALSELRKLCKPQPVPIQRLERLAVLRDDMGEEHRADQRIMDLLEFEGDQNPHILLFGSRGCGKSTELRRLCLTYQQRFLAVGVSIDREFLQKERLLPEEVIYVACLAVARSVEQVWGADLESLVQSLDDAFRPLVPPEQAPLVNAREVFHSISPFGIIRLNSTSVETAETFDLEAESGVPAPLPFRLADEVVPPRAVRYAVLEAANALLDEVRLRTGRLPLLLIDDLDKLRNPEASFQLLMDEQLLSSLRCPMVISAPTPLLHDTRQKALLELYQDVCHLYHIRCWDSGNPERLDVTGADKLREIIHRRVLAVSPEVRAVLTEPAEDLLIYQSSGVVRDLLHLLGNAALKAERHATRIESVHANAAVAMLRRTYELALTQTRLDCLYRVRRSRMLEDGGGEGRVAYELLDDNYIVAYSNHRLWYYPHAILLGFLEG